MKRTDEDPPSPGSLLEEQRPTKMQAAAPAAKQKEKAH
ncbi:hypothetical protein FHX51_000400 [Aeriscardovia aeriphila]|nr:hypothetical protein [Aeriscardovia aeriphila]